jgi:hypothetical protein
VTRHLPEVTAPFPSQTPHFEQNHPGTAPETLTLPRRRKL